MSTLSEKTDVLRLSDFGWLVELKRDKDGTSVSISTPDVPGAYSKTVRKDGTVVEYIAGDYVRVVMGSVLEKTVGSQVISSELPAIIKSDSYVALSGDSVHLQPEELKGALKELIPAKLSTYPLPPPEFKAL
jgi:hypothetical protein